MRGLYRPPARTPGADLDFLIRATATSAISCPREQRRTRVLVEAGVRDAAPRCGQWGQILIFDRVARSKIKICPRCHRARTTGNTFSARCADPVQGSAAVA